MRVLLYCHNVLGLGHIVRSLRIAERLTDEAEVRLITGCRFLDSLRIPAGVEIAHLPALRADPDGSMHPVDGGFLGSVMRRRSQLIASQVREWSPHALLVDHNPLGLVAELVETIDSIRRDDLPTRLVWGIRDIWSSPDSVRSAAQRFGGGPEAIRERIKSYHSAIAYTDETWIPTLEGYRDLMMPARTACVGFVAERISSSVAATGLPIVAVLSGGGEGAARLASLVIAAAPGLAAHLRFVVGPFDSPDEVRARAGGRENVEIWPEGTVADAIRDASLIVSRAGYNTSYSVIQSALPIVFIPLQTGSQEQGTRAARLAALDRVQVVDEREAAAPAALRECIEQGLAAGARPRSLPFSIDGAERAARWILGAAMEVL